MSMRNYIYNFAPQKNKYKLLLIKNIMNIKQTFFSGLLSLFSCLAAWGGESATVTLKKSDDGKTLTITASGDITNYSGIFNETSYSFNPTAVGKVFTLVSEGNYQSVTDGTAYVSSSTYYKEILGDKTEIENFISKVNYFSTSTAKSWTQKAIEEEVYTYIRNNQIGNTNKYWTSGTPQRVYHSTPITNNICVASSYNQDWDLREYVNNTDNGDKYYKSISEADLNNYITTTTTYTAKQTFYYSTDEGSTLTKVENGQTFVYNESYKYYTVASSTYQLYTDVEKAAWVTGDNSGYITTAINSSEKTFVEVLRDNLAGVTKLLFKEATQGCGITIDKEIVKTILLPTKNHEYNNPNKTIEELDLGSTTITDLTSDCFDVSYAAQHFNLAKLTLPKTQIVDGGMVVPEGVISKFAINTNTKLISVIIPEGYTKIGDKAFIDIVNVKEFSLPSTIKEIGTSAFENCKAMNDIALNEELVTVGKRAFIGSGLNVTPVFPSTLKNILAEAYSGLKNISELKFNQGLEFIGNCAFYSDSKINDCQEVISFPSSIKYIGPGAFSGRWFKDIYFYSEKAPLCPVGVLASNTSYTVSAFDDNIHMGNNGFQPAGSENVDLTYTADIIANGYANRMNYINHDYYLAMLHFPVGISEDNAKTYTDITRVYKTQRNTDGSFYATAQIVVGKEESVLDYNGWSNNCLKFVNPGYEDTYLGNQYIWPSQTQWMRSFVCNSFGLEWDGVTTYRPTLSEEDVALMIKDELTIKDNNNSVKITDDNKGTYSGELSKIAYLGTRQFVFADGDHSEQTSYTIEVKGGQWWTLCVPFNMTKKEIDDVFGKNTHVCLFSGVDRVGNAENNSITFKFQHDVYRHKTVKSDDGKYSENFTNETSACEDNDIVIYAHQAYMVYPTKTDEDAVFVVNDYVPISGSPMPTIVNATDGTEYRFVGNYTTKIGGDSDKEVSTAAIVDVTIPKYSYMYAKRKGDANYQFWFYSGTNMNWKANKCVVQTTEKGGGEKDYTAFFVNPTNSAKQYSIFGMDMEDSEATGMENVTVIAGEQSEEVIYDICGRRISSPEKGLYIKNGKKYIKH